MKKMIKIKVIDRDELYNFGIHHFFSWKSFNDWKSRSNLSFFLNLKIWSAQTLSNEKNDQINTLTWEGKILENFRKKIITFGVSYKLGRKTSYKF